MNRLRTTRATIQTSPIELLAPAKDATLGALAVNSGADAVYIGAGPFSARKEANNSVAEIAALVRHAHLYQARVYAALNTVLTDDEVERAQRLLDELYDVGVDGVIVQDMGLLAAGVPKMPVIASTQVHNFDAAGVRFLEQIGVQRAILARELRPVQIAEICAATSTIELECFVHGALCVSYSGRCYLSAAAGGRSANRGECAQPCRKKYELVDAAQRVHASGHLLSVRDLCRLNELAALRDAGVTSFKIEGRLKNAAYVQTTVTAYRRALNQLLEAQSEPFGDRIVGASGGHVHKVFHRGFTPHFATGSERMATFLTPKMVGEQVGEVVAVNGQQVRLRGDALHAGDGLCYFVNDGLVGTRVQRIVEDIRGDWAVLQRTDGIQKGMTLYRNRDHQFLKALEKQPPMRKVPVQMNLTAHGETITVRAWDHQGNEAVVDKPGFAAAAKNVAQMRQAVQRAMQKTGDTPYELTSLDVGEKPLPFVPVSVLNNMRRAVLAQLSERRHAQMEAARLENAFRFTPASYPKPVDEYHNVCNGYAEQFYQRCGVSAVTPGVEQTRQFTGAQVMVSKYCLRRELGACLKEAGGSQLPKRLWLREPNASRGQLELQFDCARCEMRVMWHGPEQSQPKEHP